MPRLNIPTAHHRVFSKIALMDEATIDQLESSLTELEADFEDLNLTKWLSDRVKSISKDDIKHVVRSLAGLFAVKELNNRTVDEIVNDAIETLEADKPRDLPAAQLKVLSARLNRLMSAGDGLNVLAKTISVISEQDKTFLGAKISSDLRPIFLKSPNEVYAAVVIHNLSVSYRQNGESKKLCVAMNPTDVSDLKKAIERAEIKTKALEAFVKKAGIRYLLDTE